MRTYIFIGFLVFIASSHLHKASASTDRDLYLDEEGSGDDDPPLTPTHISTRKGEHEEGSGSSPDEFADTGGDVGDTYEDDEDNYYQYEDYKAEEDTGETRPSADHYDDNMEGSAWMPDYEHPTTHHKEDHIQGREDDIYYSRPGPKEESPHEGYIPIAAPAPATPEVISTEPPRMPSSTTTQTLTDMDKSFTIVTNNDEERQVSIFAQPGILAAFIGGTVMGLLCAILLVMFIVYRMRKRDEGSYPLDEPKRVPLTSSYSPNDKEIYA